MRYRKVLVMILVLIMTILPAFNLYNQANADALIVALGVKLFGAICTALGVTFLTAVGVKATYDLWTGNLPGPEMHLKAKLDTEAVRVYSDVQTYSSGNYMGDLHMLGRAVVADDVYTSIRSFVQDEFQQGTGITKTFIPKTHVSDLPVVYNMNSYNNLGYDVTINNARYDLRYVSTYAGVGRYWIYLDNVRYGTAVIESYAQPYFSINYNSVTDTLQLLVIAIERDYNYSTGEYEYYDQWVRGYTIDEDFVFPESRTIAYDGADVLGLPSYDWEYENERVIAFPLLAGNNPDTMVSDLELIIGRDYEFAQLATPADYGLDIDGDTGGGIGNPPIEGGISEGFLSNLLNGLLEALKAFLNLLFGPLIELIRDIYELLQSLWEWLTTSDVINFPLKERFQNKFQISPLTNAWAKFQNMTTAKGNPPVIKVNLNQILNASTKEFIQLESPFPTDEITFIDFGVLEEYQFMGMALIDFFRTLIGAGFIMTTIHYVWNKIHPKEVI